MADRDRPKQPGAPSEISQDPETPESAEPQQPGVEPSTPIAVTGIDIEAALRGISFPVTGRDLIEMARKSGVEEHVLDRLTELPDRRFTSLGDTLRQLDMLS